MNILVIGSGGREHALAWRMTQDGHAVKVAPGNGGTAGLGNVALATDDHPGIADYCRAQQIALVVVGPEAPLVAGLADRLRAQGTLVFGPGAAGARLEGSKIFCKDFFLRHHIPTARSACCETLVAAEFFIAGNDGAAGYGWPLVIKADGLAAGKGVVIALDASTALETVRDFMRGALGGAGRRLLIEEHLSGPEISVLAITDGQRLALLPVGRDHKRIFSGDRGPNTGGMGVFAPAPEVTPALLGRIRAEILEPTLAGLQRDGVDYRGVLFAGLMLTPAGPRMLEYNCRFGDPETEAVLPLIEGDFAALLHSAAAGALRPELLREKKSATCCVVLAAAGYPGPVRGGDEIFGLDAAAREALIFHSGTLVRDGTLRSQGGRVIAVVGEGASASAARARAYAAIQKIHWRGMQFRDDIGLGQS